MFEDAYDFEQASRLRRVAQVHHGVVGHASLAELRAWDRLYAVQLRVCAYGDEECLLDQDEQERADAAPLPHAVGDRERVARFAVHFHTKLKIFVHDLHEMSEFRWHAHCL